ncbi:MAG: aspartate carbamoyltransferase, partial [Patescibacteria group bacterium]
IGRVDGIHVALVGDLKYGRAPRSLAYLLGKYNGVRLTLVSPKELALSDEIKEYLDGHGVDYQEAEMLDGAMKEVDVVYQTRIQKERFPNKEEYERFRGHYVIDRPMADSMKEGAIIIHPLPRVGEIAPEVDDSPHAVYFKQVGYGLMVRMALLKMVLSEA